MKTIMIGAGGTATAWHLASVAKQHFPDSIRLLVSDINPPHLIPASQLADRFFQVPKISDPSYFDAMLTIFENEKVDVYVPLIDYDVYGFYRDHPSLERLGVYSTGVDLKTAEILKSKSKTADFLLEHGVCSPRTLDRDWLEKHSDDNVFVKPKNGFGSKDSVKVSAHEAIELLNDNPDLIAQELCTEPEVTVEVYNVDGNIRTMCRERIEVKAGVCTKAKVWCDQELHDLTISICRVFNMPSAFCYQVMKNSEKQWAVTDINPRMGAGTALCTAYGWSLARAALSHWSGRGDGIEHLQSHEKPKHVVRVFQEIVLD